jgi:3-carboxy-cis,cis-muconate cycloisomerase
VVWAPFFNRHWIDSAAQSIWSDDNTLAMWIRVEVALAQVQGKLGIIPAAAAERIAEVGRRQEDFDLDVIVADIQRTQHPLVPVLREFERLVGPESGGWLHWGATTQNIMETAQALQLQSSVDLMLANIDAVMKRLIGLATDYRATLQAGRTHGQHALPITFGYKVAGWAYELRRHRQRLVALSPASFVARIGGGVGSYAALDGRGREVELALAKELGLGDPELGGRADFDRQASVVGAAAMAAACCERIAHDLVFLQRTELAEIQEDHYPERVGSSTMAQKRNPTRAQRVVSLARMTRSKAAPALEAMVRQDEGDGMAGGVAEFLVPELCILAVSTFSAMDALLGSIRVDAQAMERNLASSGGSIFAEAVMMHLGRTLGRGTAHRILHEVAAKAAEGGTDFSDEVRRHPHLASLAGTMDLDEIMDPARYLGDIDVVISALADGSATADGRSVNGAEMDE